MALKTISSVLGCPPDNFLEFPGTSPVGGGLHLWVPWYPMLRSHCLLQGDLVDLVWFSSSVPKVRRAGSLCKVPRAPEHPAVHRGTGQAFSILYPQAPRGRGEDEMFLPFNRKHHVVCHFSLEDVGG